MARATMKAPTRMPPTNSTGVPSSGGSSPGGGGGASGASSVTSGLAARAASAASVASGSGATGVVVQAAPAAAASAASASVSATTSGAGSSGAGSSSAVASSSTAAVVSSVSAWSACSASTSSAASAASVSARASASSGCSDPVSTSSGSGGMASLSVDKVLSPESGFWSVMAGGPYGNPGGPVCLVGRPSGPLPTQVSVSSSSAAPRFTRWRLAMSGVRDRAPPQGRPRSPRRRPPVRVLERIVLRRCRHCSRDVHQAGPS